MKVEINIRYKETFVPYRCRKPRSEEKECKVSISIREVSKSAAVPAFIVKAFQDEKRIVVMYQGKLYRQVQDRRKDDKDLPDGEPLFINQTADSIDWEWRLKDYYSERCSKDEYVSLLRRKARRYIIIDGDVYERCCEPYYSVTTFGLGRNHGGTGFFVSWANPVSRKVYGWSAIDTQAAIEAAVRVALARGDTKSEDYIRSGGNGSIEVLMPNAVTRIYDNPA
jgi:hypothetical protein